MRHAVPAALFAFADIVEERDRDEVRGVVAALKEPARGRRRVDDIAQVLRAKDGEKGLRKMRFGECEAIRGRHPRRRDELVCSVTDQVTSNS